MEITVLDGYSINPGDLTWDKLAMLGALHVHPMCAEDQVAQTIGNSQAVFVSKVNIGKAVMDQCPNLKFIGTLSTGYDHIDLEEAKLHGIAVANTPAYSTDSVAQHTIAFLLEICNNIGLHNQAVQNGEWYESDSFCFWKKPIIQLAGKSIGIIGYGSIGRKVGEIAKAFGMTVNPYSGPNKKLNDLKSAMTSDIVTLHCPAKADTINMINKEFISGMKDGAILINAARGSLVEERALADALKSGKLLAAGIDVLREEPPAYPNPLIGLENCFVTPHIAWLAKEARAVVTETAYDNLKSFLEGGTANRIV